MYGAEVTDAATAEELENCTKKEVFEFKDPGDRAKSQIPSKMFRKPQHGALRRYLNASMVGHVVEMSIGKEVAGLLCAMAPAHMKYDIRKTDRSNSHPLNVTKRKPLDDVTEVKIYIKMSIWTGASLIYKWEMRLLITHIYHVLSSI